MTAQLTQDVSLAAEMLRAGRLVAFATETVYGLGASALDENAVAGIFDAKGRPRFDPLIVHVADIAMARQYVADWPETASLLAERFWPGPLTMVLPKQPVISDLVTSGLPTVGIRLPDHPLARDLIRQAGVPVAAPSANRFGCISPTIAAHVAEQLGDRIDMILDGGSCRVGVESTILLLTGEAPTVLRLGGITVEELEDAIGPVRVSTGQGSEGDQSASPLAPGMLKKHYAPHSRLQLCDDVTTLEGGPGQGLLAFTPPQNAERFDAVEVLSPEGDLREAAAGFFAALRRLDALNLSTIWAERFPQKGLGRALNDRLQRAAADDE
ncbi:Threonylcarbamoyl-AMP synthase [Maioricimonas rarisocia]|uniref:Threonylcarbamoyl-AMP synthase n=1 Tax=Maioricimonas rarisocia TaxID=2528026 RepID=A0A517Z515_9PLAN|nr:L-threonylcarbamoyladenylate synthase [Maioricimonas rarisocia]QDU37565.1 Threonylcarbamoyl-AMP synthase [Maioricimonas rarisocia]